MSFFQPRTIYAFVSHGCEVCAEAMPNVRKWSVKHSARFFLVEVNVGIVDFKLEGMREIRETPTFAIASRGAIVAEPHIGTFDSEKQFDRFLEGSE